MIHTISKCNFFCFEFLNVDVWIQRLLLKKSYMFCHSRNSAALRPVLLYVYLTGTFIPGNVDRIWGNVIISQWNLPKPKLRFMELDQNWNEFVRIPMRNVILSCIRIKNLIKMLLKWISLGIDFLMKISSIF